MGHRVEGKKKKKSVKADVTSKFNSKRKLSRMGKKVQKGKAGPNTEFITRATALRRLQITLKDFRRLCILKGIYPRVPGKALKGNDKVYYDIKDIAYISHEPLLEKFREFKSFMKKIRKAAGRNQITDARSKNDLKPKISLDHLVKERYPRFIDALRDLEDPLCMIHLFATLPAGGRITPEHILTCSALCREWQHYVAKTQSLRKVFISIKGIYYQAEVMGEAITWLVPHSFTQSIPRGGEVDLRVMLTFLEFYEIFLKFTLFKLYHSQGWVYPPKVDAVMDKDGGSLLALEGAAGGEGATSLSLPEQKKKVKVDEKLQARVERIVEGIEEGGEEEEEEEMGESLSLPLLSALGTVGELERKVFDSSLSGGLFGGLVFFLNREVPRTSLQLCVLSCGGQVGWAGTGSPFAEGDQRITHQIVDRPLGSTPANRECVKPQWVFDSINAQVLLPVRMYAPGVKLPPHLSPFVDDEKEGYVPQFREEVRRLQGKDVGEKKEVEKVVEREEEEGEEDEEDGEESEDEEEDEEESEKEEVESIEETDKKGPKAIVYKAQTPKVSEAAELKQLSVQMMGKKTKRLYDRMQYGIKQKSEQSERLEAKRKALEEDKKEEKEKSKKPRKK